MMQWLDDPWENIPKRNAGETYGACEFAAAVKHHGVPFGPWDKDRQLPYGSKQDQWHKGPPIDPAYDERPAWLKHKADQRYSWPNDVDWWK